MESQNLAQLTPEQRRIRIKELEAELSKLRALEAADKEVDIRQLRIDCLALKNAGKSMDAITKYRYAMGCGLREAHDAVQALLPTF